MEVHFIVNSNVFYVLFATNKSFPAWTLARIRARNTQTAVNVGAYLHVRVFKSYIYRQHNCFDRMSIRRTAIKIHIF